MIVEEVEVVGVEEGAFEERESGRRRLLGHCRRSGGIGSVVCGFGGDWTAFLAVLGLDDAGFPLRRMLKLAILQGYE